MTTFMALNELKQIKNKSVFTKDQNLFEYIAGLKIRLKQYYGVDTDKFSYIDIVTFMHEKQIL